MKIKLIASDMDGTFLNSKMSYDRELFKELYNKMKAKGIHFVIASSNQYYQLKSFFGDIQDEITYICENGALIFHNKENIFKADMPKEIVKEIADVLSDNPLIKTCVCGLKSAYISKGDLDGKELIALYWPKLIEYDNFDEIYDDIVKFSLFVPVDKKDEIQEDLEKKIGHLIKPVTSGDNCIDLINPKYNKGTGIKELCNLWNISLDECMTFGDSFNDIEMLKEVKYGYAMNNADDRVKKAASYVALSNDESGVLMAIKEYLDKCE